MPHDDEIHLTIVIPALNEEESIGKTIERCLAAREPIIAQTAVATVRIVVVSDGSSDRTSTIAQGYRDVSVIVFQQNRGYGAAIKEGWRVGAGNLLAFLDADGTCDPNYFIPMCRIALEKETDIVIGNRMGANSRMPRVRRIGNNIFAALLGLLSREKVADSASGMRVVRSDSLGRLLPLPNGLHFTPAMSARALMDDTLTIEEVPMEYAERVGQSKLNILTDALRFTRVILSAAAYVKPSRLTIPIAATLALVCVLISILPAQLYLAHRAVPTWAIYRFLAVLMLGVMIVTLLCTTVLAEHMIALSRLRYDDFLRKHKSWWRRRFLLGYLGVGGVLCLLAVVLVWRGIVSYVLTGEIPETTLHWSRVVVASFFVLTFWQMLATACVLQLISALHDRQRFLTGRASHEL